MENLLSFFFFKEAQYYFFLNFRFENKAKIENFSIFLLFMACTYFRKLVKHAQFPT